jgi:hypothetical protein
VPSWVATLTPVPLPAALWLFLSATGLLGVVGRFRGKAAQVVGC